MMKILLSALLLLLCLHSSHAQTLVDGPWHGVIAIAGIELRIGVDFSSTGDSVRGTIDIPQQKAMDLALRNIRYRGDSISFELPAGPGVAMFDGVLTGDSIVGTMRQGGGSGTFHLTQGALAPEPADEGPVPYTQEEVTFTNGNTTLAGTLTIPPGKGPFPAVVMITGSGPQDRNEEIFGFKLFQVIADHLTRNGIAVLRYDDRGVGGSSGDISQSTSEDFAGDVIAGVDLLKKHKGIDKKRIGLLGHSEGGIVAPMVAARRNEISFIILMAGTGIRGEELLYAQGRAIAKASGATEEQIEQQEQNQRRVFTAAKNDRLDSIAQQFLSEARAQSPLTPEQDSATVQAINDQLGFIKSTWFRYFLAYDPAPTLRQVHCPVLLLFGGLDVQVPAELNRIAMENALKAGGNRRYRTVVFPEANHLFITAKTGGIDEYATAKKAFVPGFLDTITNFIRKK
jgi:pimeloyl-ACP methyl ester carboxylesterase